MVLLRHCNTLYSYCHFVHLICLTALRILSCWQQWYSVSWKAWKSFHFETVRVSSNKYLDGLFSDLASVSIWYNTVQFLPSGRQHRNRIIVAFTQTENIIEMDVRGTDMRGLLTFGIHKAEAQKGSSRQALSLILFIKRLPYFYVL